MIRKRYPDSTYIFIFVVWLCLPSILLAQQATRYSNSSNLSFRLILSSPTRFNIKAKEDYHGRSLQKDLFYGNAFLGLEADYFFHDHWAISPGLFFYRSSSNRNYSLMFVIAPPPGTISHFKTDYRFFNASFEPKMKFFLNYHRAMFFWSAGPAFSYAALSSQTNGAPYGHPDNFSSFSSSKSHILGFGGTASTGIQYAFTRHLDLSFQLTYQYIHFPSFNIKSPTTTTGTISYQYGLNTLSPGIGLVYSL